MRLTDLPTFVIVVDTDRRFVEDSLCLSKLRPLCCAIKTLLALVAVIRFESQRSA